MPPVSGSVKKGRRGDALGPLINTINCLVKDSNADPHVAILVPYFVKIGLRTSRNERHPYMEQCLGIVDGLLFASKAQLQRKAADLEAILANSDAEKASRGAAVEEARNALEHSEKVVQSAEEAYSATYVDVRKARTAFEYVRSRLKNAEQLFAYASERKEKLEALLTNHFYPLKEASSSKSVRAVVKFANDLAIDTNLVEAGAASLARDPALRKVFDDVVVQHLGDALLAIKLDLERTLTGTEAGHAELLAAKDEEADLVVHCEMALDSKIFALAEARRALFEAKASLKSAAKSVKNFGAEFKQASLDLAATNFKTDEAERAILTFTQLRTAIPEPDVVETEVKVDGDLHAVRQCEASE